MEKENKRVFDVSYTDSDDVKHDIICKIKQPSVEQLEESKSIYNRGFKRAIRSGALLSAKLADFIKEQELWDDKKDSQVKLLRADLHDAEVKMAKGGFSLKDARALAIKMRGLRYELRELLTVETQLENMTAESQAEEDRYNYLIAACTVYNDTEERVWKDVSDYLNPEIPEIAIAASIKYATIRWGVADNFEEKLPENAFLKKYNFVDKDLRLIREDGRPIDAQGRLVDAEGNFIDDKGNFVDSEGNPVDKEGRVVVEEFLPFLDDDGKPIADISSASKETPN